MGKNYKKLYKLFAKISLLEEKNSEKLLTKAASLIKKSRLVKEVFVGKILDDKTIKEISSFRSKQLKSLYDYINKEVKDIKSSKSILRFGLNESKFLYSNNYKEDPNFYGELIDAKTAILFTFVLDRYTKYFISFSIKKENFIDDENKDIFLALHNILTSKLKVIYKEEKENTYKDIQDLYLKIKNGFSNISLSKKDIFYIFHGFMKSFIKEKDYFTAYYISVFKDEKVRLLNKAGKNINKLIKKNKNYLEKMPCLNAIKQEREIVYDDWSFGSLNELFIPFSSSMHIPILFEDESFSLNIYSDRKGFFDENIQSLLKDIALFLRESLEDIKEKEKKEKETHFIKAITDSLSFGIWGINQEDKIIFINKKALKILRYKEKDVIGKTGHFLFHFKELNGTPKPLESCPLYKTAKDKKPRFIKKDVFWTKDKKPIIVEYSTAHLNFNKKNIGSIVSFRDISKEIEQKEKVELSFNILRRVKDAIFIIDSQTNKLYFSNIAFKNFFKEKSSENIEKMLGINVERIKSLKKPYKTSLSINKRDYLMEIFDIKTKEKDFIVGILKDITDLMNYEAKTDLLKDFYKTIYEIEKHIFQKDKKEDIFELVLNELIKFDLVYMCLIGIRQENIVIPKAIKYKSKELLDYFKDYIDPSSKSFAYDFTKNIPNATLDVYIKKQPIIVKDYAKSKYNFWKDKLLPKGIESVGSFPIKVGSEVIGNLTILAKKDILSKEFLTLLESVSESLSLKLSLLKAQEEKERLFKKIENMALHDFLTGLPNRHYLSQRLRESISKLKRGTKIAIMELDLDGFKSINDTYGHSVGDILLQELAKRLRSALRGEDIVVRLGGDEFLIVLESIEKENVEKLARKIINEINKPFIIKDKKMNVGVSIGIVFMSSYKKHYKDIFKIVDEALYKVKHSGKNNFELLEL